MSRLVEANEPYTICYQFYLNRAETKCVVHDTYTNSEAVLAHNNSVASQTALPRIFAVSRITRFDVYGNPNEELEKVVTSFIHNFTTYLLGLVVDRSVRFQCQSK
jgi:hypothetical protein